MTNQELKKTVQDTIEKLLNYCQKENWAGYDPYDGLNSRIFRGIPFFQNRIFRLAFIQAMKRSPVNFRPLFLVPKEQNPKGLALFASALTKLSNIGLLESPELVDIVLKRLIELRSPKLKYFCWGYNFDWQSRAFFLPKFTPNIICTTFAGNALLDAYDTNNDDVYLEIAVSAGEFILHGLNMTHNNDDELCFSYTPLDNGQVHNANLLGAVYLARIYSKTQEQRFIEPALKAVRFSTKKQRFDGSWVYGEDITQQWIDNFHTGYNLVALKKFSEYSGNKDFDQNIERGFMFYIDHFITSEGIAKYYHDRKYPIDIHSIAYSIITLIEFKALDKNYLNIAENILRWAFKNMQSNDGYFYIQKKPFFKYKTAYMRWSQAWMLYALAYLAQELKHKV